MKNALQSNPLKSNKQTLHIGPKGCASFLGREVGRGCFLFSFALIIRRGI